MYPEIPVPQEGEGRGGPNSIEISVSFHVLEHGGNSVPDDPVLNSKIMKQRFEITTAFAFGSLEQAIEPLVNVIELDPEEPEYRLKLIGVYLKLERIEEADNLIEESKSYFRDDIDIKDYALKFLEQELDAIKKGIPGLGGLS